MTEQVLAEEQAAKLAELNEASERLWRSRDLHEGLDAMLGATIDLLRADMGNVQLLNSGQKVLVIAAQRGFKQDFLDFFQEVVAEDDSACGRALRTGERIVVEDIEIDEPFAPMRHVARTAGYRAVQSTPLIGRDGTPFGMLSTYWASVHRPSEQDLRLLDLYARQAAYFIERCASDESLRQSKERLAAELVAMQRLQDISTQLIREEEPEALYEKIVDAAVAIMRSEYASMQMFYPEDGGGGQLRLLAFRGFDPGAAKFWEWVRADSESTCGEALRTRRQTIASDVEKCDYMAGSADLATYLQTGIHAVQTTPLTSRSGRLVGMISTHWRQPHEPDERDLRLFDALARQAADLIERTQAKQGLHESEERLRFMAQSMPQKVFTADASGNVTYFNPQWTEFTGLSFEQIRDWGWTQFIHPEDVEENVHAWRRSIETGEPFEFVHRFRRADGLYRWHLSRARPMHDAAGNISMWMGSNTDIHEQKEMTEALQQRELALRESERRFRHMADNAPMMVWVTEADASCSFLSKSWYDFTGQTPATGLGFGWLDVVHPDDGAAAHHTFVAASAKRESFYLEYRLRRKDGEYRWTIDAATPRLGPSGEFLGYIGSVIDITERKQAETTQQMLLNELNHRVKNTLASVQAIAQQTLSRTRDPADFVASFGGRIQSLARVHSQLSSTTWQGADLRDLVRDQVQLGPVDETRLTAWGPAVQLDSQMALHLALMLHELGTNACKYGALSTGSGWVTVNWTTDDALHIQWVERGGPPVARPSRRGFGTTLIEQSAKGQSGHAQMRCEADGITWEINLPLPESVASSIAPLVIQTLSPGENPRDGNLRKKLAGQRFLVVEDEPLIGLDIVAGLEEEEAQVEGPVGSAKDAIGIIERTSLDGALLDANLHGQPVDEIASALTRHNVPFVFVTGHGPEGLPEAFRGTAILSKPFSRQQVHEAAAKLVARHDSVIRLRR